MLILIKPSLVCIKLKHLYYDLCIQKWYKRKYDEKKRSRSTFLQYKKNICLFAKDVLLLIYANSIDGEIFVQSTKPYQKKKNLNLNRSNTNRQNPFDNSIKNVF